MVPNLFRWGYSEEAGGNPFMKTYASFKWRFFEAGIILTLRQPPFFPRHWYSQDKEYSFFMPYEAL